MPPFLRTPSSPTPTPWPAGAGPPGRGASIPGTRGNRTPTLRPSRSFSSERLRPNASTRMRTQPSRSGGSGSGVSRRLSTGPGAESCTARMVAGEHVMGLPSSRVGESVGGGQHGAAAASFPTPGPQPPQVDELGRRCGIRRLLAEPSADAVVDIFAVARGQRFGHGEPEGPPPVGLPRGAQEQRRSRALPVEAVGEVELVGDEEHPDPGLQERAYHLTGDL